MVRLLTVDRVMNEHVVILHGPVCLSNNMDDLYLLRVSSRNSIEGAEFA